MNSGKNKRQNYPNNLFCEVIIIFAQ